MTENKILSNIYMESNRLVSISNSSTKGARTKLKKFAGFKSIEKYSAKLFSEDKITLSERQLKLKDDKKIKGVFADLTYEYLTELYNLDVEKKRDAFSLLRSLFGSESCSSDSVKRNVDLYSSADVVAADGYITAIMHELEAT